LTRFPKICISFKAALMTPFPMPDLAKTKAQLILELEIARQRCFALDATLYSRDQTDAAGMAIRQAEIQMQNEELKEAA
jgi:hypothetical protein